MEMKRKNKLAMTTASNENDVDAIIVEQRNGSKINVDTDETPR